MFDPGLAPHLSAWSPNQQGCLVWSAIKHLGGEIFNLASSPSPSPFAFLLSAWLHHDICNDIIVSEATANPMLHLISFLPVPHIPLAAISMCGDLSVIPGTHVD